MDLNWFNLLIRPFLLVFMFFYAATASDRQARKAQRKAERQRVRNERRMQKTGRLAG